MPVSGGGDRRDLQPVKQGGNSIGSHRRQYEALNIEHPQPGFTYKWERNKDGPIRRAMALGWRFVKKDDLEMASYDDSELPLQFQHSNDSIRPLGDVVLMRQPVAKWAEQQEWLLERNRAARGEADASFKDLGERRAAEAGSAAELRGSLFFQKQGHGTFYADLNDEEET